MFRAYSSMSRISILAWNFRFCYLEGCFGVLVAVKQNHQKLHDTIGFEFYL